MLTPADEPRASSSYAFRKPDCHPTAGTDRRSQQGITQRLRRACLARRVAMLAFVGLEVADVGGERRIVAPELRQLRAIMLVDLGLDRVGAGERRFLRYERCRRAEREAGDA